jgi:hypothetical protein
MDGLFTVAYGTIPVFVSALIAYYISIGMAWNITGSIPVPLVNAVLTALIYAVMVFTIK